MLVRPAGGDCIFGRSGIAHLIFHLVLLLTVIAGIVIESIRRNYYSEHGLVRGSWFDIAESVFGLTPLMKFVIKVVADEFMFAPNAYVRSIWNVLDFFIMAGLLVNVTTGLIYIGGLSRFTRALKALRALKLVTLIEKMRSTFESLIISGTIRILDAALLYDVYDHFRGGTFLSSIKESGALPFLCMVEPLLKTIISSVAPNGNVWI